MEARNRVHRIPILHDPLLIPRVKQVISTNSIVSIVKCMASCTNERNHFFGGYVWVTIFPTNDNEIRLYVEMHGIFDNVFARMHGRIKMYSHVKYQFIVAFDFVTVFRGQRSSNICGCGCYGPVSTTEIQRIQSPQIRPISSIGRSR